MSVFNISVPSKTQVVHGVERTAIVFVLAVATYLKTTTGSVGKDLWVGAGYAGVAAVYQLVLSTITTL